MKMNRYSRAVLSAALLSCGTAMAGVTCVPTGDVTEAHWVRKISLDEHSRMVTLDIVRSRAKNVETMGKLRADLVGMEETELGEPVYVFNAIPVPGAEATHLFRLYKGNPHWRLMSATLGATGSKQPALRAVDAGSAFDCKRSAIG